MRTIGRVSFMGVWISVVLVGSLNAQVTLSQRAPASTLRPKAFGTQNYTVTTLSALAFGGASYLTNYLTRTGVLNTDQHFYFALDVPEGVVIDYIGLNNANDGTPFVIGLALYSRGALGFEDLIAGISSTPHANFGTDMNSTPIGYLHPLITGDPEELVLDIEIASSPNPQYVAWAEVWWRRTVSPAPATATFNDVPTTHPFFQYIEALHSSGITGGCQASPPLYCPNAPVTRGQMAVFLAKALGLDWPN